MEKADRIVQWLQRRCGGHHTGGTWRLRPYVRAYFTWCILERRSVTLVTVWCLTKRLETRFMEGLMTLLPRERKVINEMMEIVTMFSVRECIEYEWYILPIGSAVESGRIPDDVASTYIALLEDGCAHVPNVAVMAPLAVKADNRTLEYSMRRSDGELFNRERERRKALYAARGITVDVATLEQELAQSVAVKAGEGQWLVETFGEFLLVPVEYPERYVFHELLTPGFTDRMLPVLTPYPWRDGGQ